LFDLQVKFVVVVVVVVVVAAAAIVCQFLKAVEKTVSQDSHP
jgi:asparagine N-glycosylation enzyme membrane subunit Stt3